MSVEQIPESALDEDSIEILSLSSRRLSTEFEVDGYPLIVDYWGYRLDTENDPYLNRVTIENPITTAELTVKDFSYKSSKLAELLADDGFRGPGGAEFLNGDDDIYGDDFNDFLFGLKGKDKISGFEGDDFIHGNYGADELWGGEGNDTIRGGHGPDEIYGGEGADWIWGGIGKNTITAGWSDNSIDQIFVPADRVQNTSFGNPGGANADIIKSLGEEDVLYIHGVEDSTLTYAATSLQGSSGVGIYSEGVLEVFVQGYGWSPAEVDAITSGGFYA